MQGQKRSVDRRELGGVVRGSGRAAWWIQMFAGWGGLCLCHKCLRRSLNEGEHQRTVTQMGEKPVTPKDPVQGPCFPRGCVSSTCPEKKPDPQPACENPGEQVCVCGASYRQERAPGVSNAAV